MLPLSAIYEPIQEDLNSVEDRLRSMSQVPDKHLSELLDHSLKAGGKRVRPILTLLSGNFYNYNRDALLSMAVAVELLHTATLVHDDTIDKSAVRRGLPTVNAIWGEDKAVLLGDYLFARAGEHCANTGVVLVTKLFAQTLATISSGELRQSFDAFRLEQTREQYLARIIAKTASLFVLSTESGAVLSQAPESAVTILKEYGHNLGIAFQIVDDVLDFIGNEEELGKPVGSDLAQGTLTLPAMLLLERYPEDNPVKRFFKDPTSLDDMRQAVEWVGNSAIVEECYDIAGEYSTAACRNLNHLPDNTSRRALLALANYVIKRKE
ncbi:MAG TPA: polyprenyl synthetase family protein [Dehalococcoidia bacterium]|nr:polyprenyl synthetase family protein [Dehalococcoidia bacterium]